MMPGAKSNLLIADDEPSTRRALSEIFTEFGYSVRSAEDGLTALVEIGREIPDILLSDLNMRVFPALNCYRRSVTGFLRFV
jgi:CheY-like chemotaxis protein